MDFSNREDDVPLGDQHLGALLSAYVDKQLSEADADRVEVHLSVCEECAEAVEAIREVRGILATPPIIAPSSSLVDSLWLIQESQKAAQPDETPTRRKWPARILTTAFGLGASIALLALLGMHDLSDVSEREPQRAQSSLLNQQGGIPNLRAATYTESETALEPELRDLAQRTAALEVMSVRRDAARDEVEAIITMDDSGQAVVRERRGTLPTGDRAFGRPIEVSGYEVQLVEQAPWTAVWQRGDCVISVAADAPHDAIALIIESFPPAPVDDGIGARIWRGVLKIGQVIR